MQRGSFDAFPVNPLESLLTHEGVVSLAELAPGSDITLGLSTDAHAEPDTFLALRLQSQATDRQPATCLVTDATLGRGILEQQLQPHITIGGELQVHFACQYSTKSSLLTAVENDVIAPGKHLFVWVPLAPGGTRGFTYHAHVAYARS